MGRVLTGRGGCGEKEDADAAGRVLEMGFAMRERCGWRGCCGLGGKGVIGKVVGGYALPWGAMRRRIVSCTTIGSAGCGDAPNAGTGAAQARGSPGVDLTVRLVTRNGLT
eukprot:2002907-Rhodomonas_salina.5